MRCIGVVTVARSDYGIYLPVLRKIQADPNFNLYLYVTGMHLSPEFGYTVEMIKGDGFEVNAQVEMLLSGDTAESISKSMGLGTIGFAQAFAHFRPDILLVLGDRFEMFAAALAAVPFKIPIAHIHGGEVTQGAIDDALRHAMTKLSHLHFASTEVYARRIVQLGEEPWRVIVAGAPSLDNLHTVKLLSASEFERKYGIPMSEPPLLVTYHPVTLEFEQTEWQVGELLSALELLDRPTIFTLPNADTSGRLIIKMLKDYVQNHSRAWIVDNLGTQGYFSGMALASAMIGNSSSGIIEAASFRLPVVNIGNRQKGRTHGRNVINADYSCSSIVGAAKQALAPEFRRDLQSLNNPYGRGQASAVIVDTLREVALDERLIYKRFHDVPIQA